jgi:Phosphoglycerate dehydrogenase and related dehydrogenases
VVNTPEALSDSVAESTITEILALSKNIYGNARSLYAGDWGYKRNHPGRDLAGKTLGILGFGRIGCAVAKKLAAFDVKVIAFDPFARPTEGVEFLSLEEVLQKSDYVSVHLPALKETEGSIGYAEFEMMKETVYFINLGRGSIVREEEMIAALKDKKIAGAALDVYEVEPLPLTSSLLTLDNVLLTPHIASNTVETRERMAIHAARGIIDVLADKNPKWAVNTIEK